MQKDISSLIKTALTEYVKAHNEYSGKVMDLFNHIDDTVKAAQNLPAEIRFEVGQIIWGILVANGIIPIPLK